MIHTLLDDIDITYSNTLDAQLLWDFCKRNIKQATIEFRCNLRAVFKKCQKDELHFTLQGLHA